MSLADMDLLREIKLDTQIDRNTGWKQENKFKKTD